VATTPDRSPSGWLGRSVRSIRTRIVIGYVLLVTISLGLTIVVLRQLLLVRVERDTNALMARDSDELRNRAAAEDPATGQPFGADVTALLRDYFRGKVPETGEYFVAFLGDSLLASSTGSPIDARTATAVSGWTASAEPLRSSATVDGRTFEYQTIPLVAGGEVVATFAVLRDPSAAEDDVTRVVRTLALVGTGVALLGLFGAWLLAGRVVRPIAELTATTRSIDDRDLSARIPVNGGDELAELGRRFNEMLDRVERGMEQQRQFVDDVAHELRTPITIIGGHLELMGDDPADRVETLVIVQDELDRMNRYVADLLVLAKAGLPEFVRLAPVDVGELVGSLHQRMPALADRRWEIDEAPAPGTVAIRADQARLMQAMMNLATNAVEHTSDGAVIAVGARRTRTGVELWVRDTGTGVDPAVSDTLFDRARRGPSSRARRPDGAGIGLSIVGAIAEGHRGSVRVEQAAPTGARFVITLPVDPLEIAP
jgi:signal transduction histidine kinase